MITLLNLLARVNCWLVSKRYYGEVVFLKMNQNLLSFAILSLRNGSYTLQHNLVSDLGETLTLTGADYQLLMLFLNRPYKAISRDEICQALHGRDAFANERGIDVH